jgi:hypothetical protein
VEDVSDLDDLGAKHPRSGETCPLYYSRQRLKMISKDLELSLRGLEKLDSFSYCSLTTLIGGGG